MRALLIYNPVATRVSDRVRDVIAGALASELKLDVVRTERRGHAEQIAATAAADGYELVCCLAGDGTLNETINGLAGTPVALTPLPAGGTNVFARALGLDRDPVEATATLLERIREGAEPRRVNIGSVNGRAFGFCAGVAYDAAVVRRVEDRIKHRKTFGDWLFVSTALETFFFRYKRRKPPLTLSVPGGEDVKLHFAVTCNTAPYTFLGAAPFNLCPDARLDGGLDMTGLRSMRTVTALRVLWHGFRKGRHTGMRAVEYLHDARAFTITSDRPVPYQLDGDYIGEADRFEFALLENALTVFA